MNNNVVISVSVKFNIQILIQEREKTEKTKEKWRERKRLTAKCEVQNIFASRYSLVLCYSR